MKIRLLASLLLALLSASVYAQTGALTPAQGSPVRKAIMAVVKQKFPQARSESLFKVQEPWARVVYDPSDDGASSVNVILKKTGATWKIVWDYNAGGEEGTDVTDYIRGIPKSITHPWGGG